VDASYAGGQKCLACPPGIAPLTFGPRAMERLANRKTKVPNWYLDMNMIAQYIVPNGGSTAPRVYHHTAPISMIYALREALRIGN
jgi:alanine-glyoxylate transaminase/serine-glyoxylate transaminase/serine-pyruvate transaminase